MSALPHAAADEPTLDLGFATATGKLFSLPQSAFARGIHLLGSIGAGKTSVLRRILMAFGTEVPWVHTDFIGSGHDALERWVTFIATVLALAEHHSRRALAGTTARFLSRFAFLTIGASRPPIRVDLLRRRILPDGSRERVRDVVGRAHEVLSAKLNSPDAQLRVRFRRISTALLTALTAAERPISEAIRVLDDPMYRFFLDRRMDEAVIDPSEHAYLHHQLHELDHVLALRPFDPTKSPRAFEDMTESTRNSLADFAPGTLLGELFSDETLPLEDIAFGRTSLSITAREADELLKAQAFQAFHAILHALCLHRNADRRGADVPPLLFGIDEPRWLGRNIPAALALARNVGVSYALAHQSDAQWERIGLPQMERELRSLTNLQISFRPTSFQDAEAEVRHTRELRPDSLVQRFIAVGANEDEVDSDTVSHAWQHATNVSGTRSSENIGTNDGEGSAHGTSRGTSEHEVLNVVGLSDQVGYAAIDALRRPRFRGVVTYEGRGTEVDFFPAPEFPSVLAGVPILELFREAHDRYWRSRHVPRPVYDPTITLTSSAPAPPPPAAASPSSNPATPPRAPLNLPPNPTKPKRRRSRKRGKGGHA